MSTKIDILDPGYSIEGLLDGKTAVVNARGTSILVRSGERNYIFDVMGPFDTEFLIRRLADFKLHPDDINVVVCSHSHPDHIGNLNLFTGTRQHHYVGISSYNQQHYLTGANEFPTTDDYHNYPNVDFQEHEPLKLDSNLSLIATPGHTFEDISMIVTNCERYGTVGLAGDLFECDKDVTNDAIWIGAGSHHKELQRFMRRRLYQLVDYIVPGHGDIFQAIKGTIPA